MTAVEDGRLGLVLLPGLLPSRALPVSLPPADPSDQWPSRTSAPRQGEGGSAWSGLEGIRHPLAGFLLRLPATPCLPPYCFTVVLAPVKAHSDFHKTEQRKVLKCREALGNTPTCLPPSTSKISASPPVFSSYEHPLPITLAHTTVQLSPSRCSLQSTALKWFRAPPRKAGGKVSGVSEPAFAADTYLAVVGSVRERGGPSWRLPAAVTTQPLLSYTWCLLEGGKLFWALTAFFLPWQLFRALQSKHCAHDCVWLVMKQMLQKSLDGDRGCFCFSHPIMWPLAMV